MKTQTLLSLFCVSVLQMATVPTSSYAAGVFPDKPIRVYVATAPGTGGDAVARLTGNAVAAPLGQPFIVINHMGAGGLLAMDMGAHSPPDGYTLTLGTSSTLITSPAMNPKNANFSIKKDFIPVAALAETPYVILTANTPDAPKTLVDLLTRLKETKNGTFGSLGVGTIGHLSSELLLKRAGVSALHVPYKTSGLTDVASGRLTFASETIAGSMALISSGKLRALAVTSSQRVPGLPNVPTVAECANPQFKLGGFKLTAWWGLFAPTGTPSADIKKLSDVIVKALSQPEVKAKFATMQLTLLALPSDKFKDLVNREYPMWTDFVQQLGLTASN